MQDRGGTFCYGYGIRPTNDWKKTLGSEWASTNPLSAAGKIENRPVSLECAKLQSTAGIDRLLKGKDIMVGAIDVASEEVETPEKVAQTLRAALGNTCAEKLYPCTNCGMVPLPRGGSRKASSSPGAGAAIGA